jgi:O-antigen/teichoic acid export membrane protein
MYYRATHAYLDAIRGQSPCRSLVGGPSCGMRSGDLSSERILRVETVLGSTALEPGSDDQRLGSLAARGALATLLGRFATALLRLGSVVLLSRFVSADAFGLYGMVAVVVLLLSPLGTLGFSASTVRRLTLSDRDINAAFWMGLALSFGLTAVTLALSPMLGVFYREPRVVPISLAVAPLFVVTALGSQHEALLRRDLRFVQSATINVLSLGVALVVAVFAGWRHYEAWSLVAMAAVQPTLASVMFWCICPWRPRLPEKGLLSWKAAAFAANVSASETVTVLSRRLDYVVLGHFCGTATLGYYTRAYSLFLGPLGNFTEPFGSVAVPALSRLQSNESRFADLYGELLRALAWACTPLSVAAVIGGGDIVAVALGDDWTQSGRILSALGFGGVFLPVVLSTQWVWIALGRSRDLVAWAVTNGALTAGCVVAGAHWGAPGVAAGLSLAAAVAAPTGAVWLALRGRIRARVFWRALGGPFACGSIQAIVATSLLHWTAGAPSPARLLLLIGVIATVTAAGLAVSGDLGTLRRVLFPTKRH